MRSPKVDSFVGKLAWILFIGFVGYTVAWLLSGLLNVRFFVDWVWDRTRDFLGWFLDAIPETPESHYREGSLTWWIDHFPISSTLTLWSTSFWKVWLVWLVVALVVAIALVALWLVLSLLAKAFSGLGFGGVGGGGHAAASATGGAAAGVATGGGGEVHHHYAPDTAWTAIKKPLTILFAVVLSILMILFLVSQVKDSIDYADQHQLTKELQDDASAAKTVCGDVNFVDIDEHDARGCFGIWGNINDVPSLETIALALQMRLGKYCSEVGVNGTPDEQALAIDMAVGGIACPPSVMVKAQQWVNDTAASTPGVNLKDAAEGKIGTSINSITFPSNMSLGSRLEKYRTIIILAISVIAGVVVNRFVRRGHWIPDTRVAWGTLALCIVGIYVAISFLL